MPSQIGDANALIGGLVLQICHQLLDIATGIESMADLLIRQPKATEDGVFSHDKTSHDILMDIRTRLEPVAATVQNGSNGRQPHPLPARGVSPWAQSA